MTETNAIEEDPRGDEDLPNEEDSLENISRQITGVLEYRSKNPDALTKFRTRFIGGQ